jgi:hypothetical protein
MELVDKTMQTLPRFTSPKYVWGAGHNAPSGDAVYPDALAQYQQVGIRDWNSGSPYAWTPCASCMHPAFRKEYKIRHKAIWFEHKKQLIKDKAFGPAPVTRFTNSGNDFGFTIETLASAEVILTNSYHGVYWGTLLKRRVILVEPWSTKFKYFKHVPLVIGADQDWITMMDQTTVHEHALEECIAATESFWNKIR